MNKKLKALTIGTGILGSSFLAFLCGRNYEQLAHENDGVKVAVVYQNMPTIGASGDNARVSIDVNFKGKEFKIKDIGSFAETYDPRKNEMDPKRIKEIESDFRKRVIYSTSKSFYIDKKGNKIPELENVDFDTEARYFNESGELGDWYGFVFSLIPERQIKLEGSVR